MVNGSGAFATGHYRNLFAENGHSPQEIQNKIDSAFQQLFHGDPTNQAVFYYAGTNANGPLAYVTDIKHHDVRTEGLSYGMMITVQMNKKAEFDAIWNWSKTYLYHDSPTRPVLWFLFVAGKDERRDDERIRRAGRRIVLCHGPLLRREPLGQWHGDLQLQSRGRPVADQHAASRSQSPDNFSCSEEIQTRAPILR